MLTTALAFQASLFAATKTVSRPKGTASFLMIAELSNTLPETAVNVRTPT